MTARVCLIRNGKVNLFGMAGTAEGRAGSALHGDHSTDQFVANALNTAATVNSAGNANTAGTEHPSVDRSTWLRRLRT